MTLTKGWPLCCIWHSNIRNNGTAPARIRSFALSKLFLVCSVRESNPLFSSCIVTDILIGKYLIGWCYNYSEISFLRWWKGSIDEIWQWIKVWLIANAVWQNLIVSTLDLYYMNLNALTCVSYIISAVFSFTTLIKELHMDAVIGFTMNSSITLNTIIERNIRICLYSNLFAMELYSAITIMIWSIMIL